MSEFPSELDQALAHYSARRFEQAETICRQLLQREPNNARVLHTCAAAVAQQRRLIDSIQLLMRATQADPQFFEAWDDLARLHDAARDPIQSAAAMEHAATLRPEDVRLLIRWSSSLVSANRPSAAETIARRALKLQPGSAEAFFHLGCALEHQNRLDEAIESYRKTVELEPRLAGAYVNLGAALHQQNQLEPAEQAFARAVQLDPRNGLAQTNWAMILAELDRMDEAESAARKAVELEPNNSTFASNLATVLARRDRYEEALPIVERSIQLDPSNSLAHTQAGMVLLSLGRWREAWPHWDYRTHGWDTRPTGRKPWDGSPLSGRSIVVRAEQGFGDTIQCLRFVPLLKSHFGAGRLLIECQRPLKELLGTVPGVDEVHAKQDSQAAGELEVWVMSLPRHFDTTPTKIPGDVPFLSPDPARMDRLRPIVDKAPRGLKVGLVWGGSPTYRADRARSCPISELTPVIRLPGVTCFSLQRGAAQARDAAAIAELGLIDLGNACQDITDLAAAIALMDLVISVDTSAAHLAGAMARAVWTMLSDMADWRYRAQPDKTGWYPTMRIFRQPTPGDWDGVVNQVVSALLERGVMTQPADPNSYDAWVDLARQMLASGREDEAIRCFEAAAKLRPDPVQYLALGDHLLRLGRYAQGVAHYERAMSLRPDDAEIRRQISQSLLNVRESAAAEVVARDALRIDASSIGSRMNLALALLQQNRLEETVEELERVIAQDQSLAIAIAKLGQALARLGRIDEAESAARRAIELEPNLSTHWADLAKVLLQRPCARDALSAARRGIELNPNDFTAHGYAAQALIRLGEWEQGWIEHEWRLRAGFVTPLGLPTWDGSPLNGRTIVLQCEQGFGDAIQFIRYAPLVRQRGAGRIIARCHLAIRELFSKADGVDDAVTFDQPVADAACAIWTMSLPHRFGTTLQSVPSQVPYLHHDPARMPPLSGGFKVGMVWAGNATHADDRLRSMPLERLEPLTKVPGISCFSLQKPAARFAEDMARLQLTDLGSGLTDFADLAVAIAAMDLVISVDTGPAHLAGAMGRPVWLLLPHVAEWRWMENRADCPWYPSMRLFRQPTPGDWDGVVGQVVAALKDRV